jgi:hypothetical protein
VKKISLSVIFMIMVANTLPSEQTENGSQCQLKIRYNQQEMPDAARRERRLNVLLGLSDHVSPRRRVLALTKD